MAQSGKQALIIWGGWDGHTPYPSSLMALELLEEEGFTVKMENSLKPYLDMELLESLDLLVQCWTQGSADDEKIMMDGGGTKNLSNAILDGLGFAGWHGGMNDSFRRDTEYQFLTGSQWVAHPGGVIDFEVNIVSDDPIVNGIDDFKLKSEQYYCHVDPGIISGINGKVLATTTFKSNIMPWNGVVMPFAYKKYWGDGRIFYAAYGHTFSDFEVEGAKEILRRGMSWATRGDD
ncbi:ThuA domain-containing protein [Candidatus Bathyarchaeota archaeon]|nr:ThuA domain-containing protein [Candidatus Bathyarchaeota archaeon]